MTKLEVKTASAAVKDLLLSNPDGLRAVIRAVLQEVLEAEMDEALGAARASAHPSGSATVRATTAARCLPGGQAGAQGSAGPGRPLLDRAVRALPALGTSLGFAELYVQGVSTRKVKAITEEPCGHAFSASAISAIDKRRDDSLAAFAGRPLVEPFPYLILDARHEKVREAGIVTSRRRPAGPPIHPRSGAGQGTGAGRC